MRLTNILLGAALAAGTFATTAGAADLMWGRNGIRTRPATLSPVDAGRYTWLKLNCYGCHGDNAAGGMGPNIQHTEKGDVASAMLHGDAREGGMRSFAKYATATDAANVATYLKSIGTANEPKWLDWWNR